MEKDNKYKEIHGAEGIVVHNGKIVFGLQKEKRWYNLLNHQRVGIIKTIGGAIEKEDQGSSREALKREIQEEIKGLGTDDIKITKRPIFHKETTMGKMNKYERKSDLKMNADFYAVEIMKKENLEPNDLPALVEMPISEFLNIVYKNENIENKDIQKYILENKDRNISLPDKYTMMLPDEVTAFFRELIKTPTTEAER